MNAIRFRLAVALAAMVVPAAAFSQAPADLAKAPAWQPPAVEDVRADAMAWLDARNVDEAVRTEAEKVWSEVPEQASGAELLEALARTFALADEDARALVELCSHPREVLVPPSFPWLAAEDSPTLVARNLRLIYGRWLAREALYDEALEQIGALKPEEVVDPASLLFYQGVVHHRLLNQKEGLAAIEQLLDGAAQSPRRYEAVARLMEADLEGLKEDTLDHIARRMDDVGRRLDLGRAGPRVRGIEDGIVESLDKLIKELEEQQQQQQQSGSAGNNIQSQSPMPDSQLAGGRGRGDVTPRNLGSESGWGNLPPKEREEALQQIGREFPAHYRDVIEQYFRRLAAEPSE